MHKQEVADETAYRKALRICSGLCEASIRLYFKKPSALGQEKVRLLDHITRTLRRETPLRSQGPPPTPPARQARRMALLTQLSVPSESYHLEVIRRLVHEAGRRHINLAIYEMSVGDGSDPLERLLVHARPDGLVVLRRTPTPSDLELLFRFQVPTVLIHADRYRYPQPVMANIIPDQNQIAEVLAKWLDRPDAPWKARPGSPRSRRRPRAVLVSMREEMPAGHWPAAAPGVEISLRNDRRRRMLEALRRFEVHVREVPDYSFRHAMAVVREDPDVDLYVCLADTIGVALKHVLIAMGRHWRGRVLGFDDSPLAEAEDLSSFGQGLEAAADNAIGTLCRYLASPWTGFSENSVPVILSERGGGAVGK
jgi:DNA-binding LacI/PurR family transcriptional regulator